jgi:hypothetical protein
MCGQNLRLLAVCLDSQISLKDLLHENKIGKISRNKSLFHIKIYLQYLIARNFSKNGGTK